MIHHVGMAELKIATEEHALRTFGLGSCVGLALYDEVAHIAGLAHIMLPASPTEAPHHVAKYVNTAVPRLASLMIEQGAAKRRIRAKLAGGAQMFATLSGVDLMRVGPRNVEATQEALRSLGVPLVASDVGGHYGRTITLECLTGKLWIRSVQHGEYCI